MTPMRNPLGAIRLVYRKSSALTKIVVLVAAALSAVALLVLQEGVDASKQTTQHLRQQAIALEQENGRLEQYIHELGSVQSIVRIAQQELGLVEPDTIIIQPE